MALATQCPHCQTTFRVVHDQLKLRAGLVRCGSCKQIFNGIEHLLRPDHVSQTAAKNPLTSTPTPPSEVIRFIPAKPAPQPIVRIDTPEALVKTETENISPAESFEQFSNTVTPEPSDPLQRMTLMDFAQAGDEDEADASEETQQELIVSPPSDANANANPGSTHLPSETKIEESVPDELDRAIDDLTQKPWRGDTPAAEHDPSDDMIAAEADEPDFVTQGRRRQRLGHSVRSSMLIASVFLSITLIGQSAYAFRNQLAAWIPATKPMLSTACNLFNCQVTLPAQADAVSIESSELQALSPQKNTFALTILLRNLSSTAQSWPHLELTLNDVNERALVRRVFSPNEYLSQRQDLAEGFAASSEQPVKIPFELLQIKASGYRVYLFYP